jgi:hypothetical protein
VRRRRERAGQLTDRPRRIDLGHVAVWERTGTDAVDPGVRDNAFTTAERQHASLALLTRRIGRRVGDQPLRSMQCATECRPSSAWPPEIRALGSYRMAPSTSWGFVNTVPFRSD